MQIFLESERLVLRQFTEDDVDNLVERSSPTTHVAPVALFMPAKSERYTISLELPAE